MTSKVGGDFMKREVKETVDFDEEDGDLSACQDAYRGGGIDNM